MVKRNPKFGDEVIERSFVLRGSVSPLQGDMRKARRGHTPTRPMAGWLMVYAMLKADGAMQLVVDRENHIMEAAAELGRIDWTEYLKKGLWNDTHTTRIVGVSTNLEFHDGSSELSKAHRKVGFWTSGHLFDRDDPASWELYTDRVPTEEELAKSDRFWTIANALKDTPRPLGLSAHGKMALSPCRTRILYAKCDEAALCELPHNPASTAEPMLLGELLRGSPLEWMRKGMVKRHDRPCGACKCPPNVACLAMRKAGKGHSTRIGNDRALAGNESRALHVRKNEIEGGDEPGALDPDDIDLDNPSERLALLVALIQQKFYVSERDALRWVRNYLIRDERTQQEA